MAGCKSYATAAQHSLGRVWGGVAPHQDSAGGVAEGSYKVWTINIAQAGRTLATVLTIETDFKHKAHAAVRIMLVDSRSDSAGALGWRLMGASTPASSNTDICLVNSIVRLVQPS